MITIAAALKNRLVQVLVVCVFAALCGLTIILMAKEIRTLKNDNERLEKNFAASKEELKEFKTSSGQTGYQSTVMELRLNELIALYPSLVDEIRNLKVKPSRAENISRTSYGYEKYITTELRDSTVHDTLPVKVFSYKDPWYQVYGIANDSLQQVTISLQDALVQVVYRGEREKPWLWIFSPRKLQQRVSLKNPSATVVFTDVIELQKRKGKKK